MIEANQKFWYLNLQPSSSFTTLRQPFQFQPDLQITPIEKIRVPLKSRDALPSILAGLQWIWMHPTLKAEIFALLEAKILAGKQAAGRTGLGRWPILVLGIVRLGLDADWDRRADMAVGRALAAKVQPSLLERCDLSVEATRWEQLAYFHAMLDKPLDLVARRLLNAETIPGHEKVFSLFEPHTEWIQKGQQRLDVELGPQRLLATDQQPLIQASAVLRSEAEVDQSIPVADRLLGRYGAGSVASLRFDKGFTHTADRELLSLYIPEIVMPKRGKKNASETERCGGCVADETAGRGKCWGKPGTSGARPGSVMTS